MGVPDLKDYYMASLLDQMRFWLQDSNTRPWCKLEQESISLGSLRSLLLANTNPQSLQIGSDHPTISATLTAWKYYLNCGISIEQPVTIPLPMADLKFLLPDLSLKHWEAN